MALRTGDGNVSASNVNWVEVRVFDITERRNSCECNCRAILELTKEDDFGAAGLKLVAFTTITEEETLAADELVKRAADVLETLTEVCIVVATLKQLQALLNFFGFIEQ